MDRTRRRGSGRSSDNSGSSEGGPVPVGPGPVDAELFPDRETRLAIDDGARSARFRALLDEGGPILADGAMGTMLFSAGLQFGDPPELWNLGHPDVVRRIHRGYLEAGSRIIMTNTFGGNRLRLGMHGNQDRVDELNRTAAILCRAEVNAAGGTALVAGRHRP